MTTCPTCGAAPGVLRGEDIVSVRGRRVVSRCPRCRRLVETTLRAPTAAERLFGEVRG